MKEFFFIFVVFALLVANVWAGKPRTSEDREKSKQGYEALSKKQDEAGCRLVCENGQIQYYRGNKNIGFLVDGVCQTGGIGNPLISKYKDVIKNCLREP